MTGRMRFKAVLASLAMFVAGRSGSRRISIPTHYADYSLAGRRSHGRRRTRDGGGRVKTPGSADHHRQQGGRRRHCRACDDGRDREA